MIDAGDHSKPYLALSYCWGSSVPFTSTTANIAERKRGTKFDKLPKTFQDAATLTRALGYRYIWIDALCTLQNSVEDWDVESSKMASIYANAVLTISAAHGKDTTAGCFHTRTHYFCDEDTDEVSPRELSTTSFRYRPARGRWQTVYVSRAFHHDIVRRDADGPRSPVFTRAWTFQERLLSARAVHFTQDEASWECHTLMDCECGSLEHTWSDQPRLDNSLYLNSKAMAEIRNSTKRLASFHGDFLPNGWISPERLLALNHWRLLVEEYSDRKLGYASDKLKAISGVARRIQLPEFGRYYAGSWAVEYPMALVWFYLAPSIETDHDEGPRQKKEKQKTQQQHQEQTYRAPS